eukprot:scaffold7401_cov133-Skeletonema_dohrnii-CCMP3373.AAC.2
MPDAMGVALNSSVVASHQVQLTGGGNLGSNNDNTSVIPAGATGVSVNTTGQNNIMEERSTGENTNTLSNSRDTSNASSMGPPVAAANATAVSISPDGAPATAVTSQQQPRRRSSSGRQQLPPHDLVNHPITVEHASGRKWVAAENNCVKGDITNGAPVISWYQKSPLGEKVYPDNPQFNGTTRQMTRLESLQLMWPPKPKHLELVLELTNQNLKATGKQELTQQELVKWLGACLLITRLDYFGSRRDLWDDPKSYSRYIPAPDFKKTGMSRHRFEDIWSSLRWSKQLENAGGKCGQQSTRVCNKCKHPTDPHQKQYFVCLPCNGKECNGWLKHLEWHKQNDA